VTGLSRTAFYYEPKQTDDTEIVAQLNEIVERHPRWGFPKCFARLRALNKPWNRKRVYRIYTEQKLNLRALKKKRLPPRSPAPLTTPEKMGMSWSMDFMSDSLYSKVRFRTLNVIDDFNREVLGIDVGIGMPSARVTRYLDRLAAWHGYPEKIRVDNGPEFTSFDFIEWSKRHNVTIDYISPGCPYQNAYIERFNRTYRQEVLGMYLFNTLREVRELTEGWIDIYNTERPHDSLNNLTPSEFKMSA